MPLSFYQVSTENLVLAAIAALIYDTDEFISQAMFRTRDDAIAILSEVLARGEDEMLNLKNIFVADNDDNIEGVILWVQGPLHWSSEALRQAADRVNIQLANTLSLVEEQYFPEYSQLDRDTIILLNVCVSSRGNKVGSRMLEAFIDEHRGSPMMLHVLADNEPALRLYRRHGFEVTAKCNGFSTDGRELPCFEMRRILKGGNVHE